MTIEYRQITEQEIRERVRNRYEKNIGELKALHFEELCFMEESMAALGLSNGLFVFLGALIALPLEVSKVRRNLRVCIFSVLMASRECDTYVTPMGLGIKFYTGFTDGTCVITTNFQSDTIHDDAKKLYKSGQPSSIEDAWQRHQNHINDLVAKGKQRNYQLSFDDYAKLTRREDSYMMSSGPFGALGFVDIGSMFLTLLMFICLAIAAVLIFTVLPVIVHNAYPTCKSVENAGQFRWLQRFLIVSACIAFSWLLARVQKNTFTIDAIGTALYGNTPALEGRGYIATKWLVFLILPILPVRSYQIDGEYSKSARPQPDEMHPLHELHWDQVWETIWRFKLGYLLAIAAFLGIGVWLLSQCM
jgi:hypothetical protein